MDTDDAIVGTILTRREVFGRAARGGLGLTLGGLLLGGRDADAAHQEQARQAVKLVASPAVTEGPFFVDEKLQRTDLRAGTTRPSVVNGVRLTLALTLYRLTEGKFVPLPGATVDIWHADAHGVYSDESAPTNHENTAGQKWLRGYQVSDADGIVRFTTIFPGWYPGRTTHIHFKVRQVAVGAGATKEFTSQLFFDDAFADRIFAKAPYMARDSQQARNASDNIFSERLRDGKPVGESLMLNPSAAQDGHGYAAAFAVALTDENLRTGRGRGRDGRPPFGGPGGGGPPPFGPPPGVFDRDGPGRS